MKDEPVDAMILPSSLVPAKGGFRPKLIKLPKTGPLWGKSYNRVLYCKLLCRVGDKVRTGGFDFEGTFLKPGAVLPETALRPNELYPAAPVVLECAGLSDTRGPRWKNSHEQYSLYLLWRLEDGKWVELARCQAKQTEWAYALAPVARKAITEQGIVVAPQRDLAVLTRRADAYIEKVMKPLEPAEKWSFVSILHDVLAAKIAFWAEAS